MCCSSQANGLAATLMANVAPTPSSATNTSSPAYQQYWLLQAIRPAPEQQAAKANPAKNALIPVVMAYTSTPTTQPTAA